MTAVFMNDEMSLMCKNSTGGTDSDGYFIPVCSLSGLPCETVQRYADEACKYEVEGNND